MHDRCPCVDVQKLFFWKLAGFIQRHVTPAPRSTSSRTSPGFAAQPVQRVWLCGGTPDNPSAAGRLEVPFAVVRDCRMPKGVKILSRAAKNSFQRKVFNALSLKMLVASTLHEKNRKNILGSESRLGHCKRENVWHHFRSGQGGPVESESRHADRCLG
jgi:hypothetical protein